jgi:hypothetical protein
MARSPDPATRSTRIAANAAAFSVVAFAILWFATTQVAAIRAVSPFADDPWDAVATYAAIFLPFVAGPTWIRSLTHRGPSLPVAIAGRIRWGSGLAGGIVLVAVAADAQAIVSRGLPADGGRTAGLIVGLVAWSAVASIAAIVLVGRSARQATPSRRPIEAGGNDPAEPDIVDDLLALASAGAERLGLGRPAARSAAALERFLETSALSPRRHRLLFGVALAAAAAAAFDLWHAIAEGPSPSLVVPLIFGTLVGSGVLGIYLGTLGPLRILRPPRS